MNINPVIGSLPQPEERDFSGELAFQASRSSGAGGQNVNKVNTKVELRFDLMASSLLTPDEKQVIRTSAGRKVNRNGILIITSQKERTQAGNKSQCIFKFYQLIFKALQPEEIRVPTKPTRSSKESRLKQKRSVSEKKERRNNSFPEL
jgi:ribosome-associated protein